MRIEQTPDHLESRLRDHIEALTRLGPRHPSHPAAVRAALSYLTDTLEALGYQVQLVEYGPHIQNVNLIASVDPRDHHGPVMDLGAHWDTVAGSPGADDNASGVAGLLEIARELAGDTSRRRVRFCFFGDEEDSGQYPQGRGGSREHIRRREADGVEVDGAIVLEMIGFTDSRPGSQKLPRTSADSDGSGEGDLAGDFIAAVGNERSRDYVDALVSAAQSLDPTAPVAPVVTEDGSPDLARSDHSSFWEAGLKGVMLTDTANFRNPHYHSAADCLDTLDLAFAAQVTRVVIGAVRELVS